MSCDPAAELIAAAEERSAKALEAYHLAVEDLERARKQEIAARIALTAAITAAACAYDQVV